MASSGTPGSWNQRTAAAVRGWSWSIVCGAPTSRSSGGRSAVQTSSGTSAWWASTTAGCSSAAAVPLCTAAPPGGPWPARGRGPGTAAERSSWWTWSRRRGSAASARASGVDREPGATTASVTPGPHPLVDERGAERGGGGHGHAAYLGLDGGCTSSARAPGAAAGSCSCTASPRPAGRGPPIAADLAVDHEVVARRRARPRRLGGGATPTCRRAPSCSAEAGGPGRVRRLLDGRAPRPARSPSPARAGRRRWCCIGATAGIEDAAERAAPAGGRRGAGRIASSATASTRSSSGGWPARCSPRCRPRPPGSTSAGATRAAGLAVEPPRWPAPAPRSRCGTGSAELTHARARAGRRARRQVHAPSAGAWPRPSARTRRSPPSRRRPRRPPRAAGRLPGRSCGLARDAAPLTARARAVDRLRRLHRTRRCDFRSGRT